MALGLQLHRRILRAGCVGRTAWAINTMVLARRSWWPSVFPPFVSGNLSVVGQLPYTWYRSGCLWWSVQAPNPRVARNIVYHSKPFQRRVSIAGQVDVSRAGSWGPERGGTGFLVVEMLSRGLGWAFFFLLWKLYCLERRNLGIFLMYPGFLLQEWPPEAGMNWRACLPPWGPRQRPGGGAPSQLGTWRCLPGGQRLWVDTKKTQDLKIEMNECFSFSPAINVYL